MLFLLLEGSLILLDNVKRSRHHKEAYAGNTINVREPRRMPHFYVAHFILLG